MRFSGTGSLQWKLKRLAFHLLFRHEAQILVAFVEYAWDLKQLQCTCILMYHKRKLFLFC